MSERHSDGASAARGLAEWLSLAAAPTFAAMALLTELFGGVGPETFCSAMAGASPLSGMIPMYLLMSAFHATPWLKLISGRGHRLFERLRVIQAALTR
jgi:hypothetical protein